MSCPRCKGHLALDTYEGFPIERCTGCGGFLVGREQLAGILHSREAEFTPAQRQEAMRQAGSGISQKEHESTELCPRCSKEMTPMNFSYSSGVILDVCPEHGVWLDSGELERLQAFNEAWADRVPELRQEHGAALSKIASETAPASGAGPARGLFARILGWLSSRKD